MDQLLAALPLLACPIMMGAMMLMMMRGHGTHDHQDAAKADEVAQLRAEVEKMRDAKNSAE